MNDPKKQLYLLQHMNFLSLDINDESKDFLHGIHGLRFKLENPLQGEGIPSAGWGTVLSFPGLTEVHDP